MKRNWMAALVAVMTMVVFGACVSYSHFNSGLRSGDFFYRRTEHGDGVTITSYVGRDANVQIPSYIRRRPVRIIGAGAFSGDFAGELSEIFGEELREELRGALGGVPVGRNFGGSWVYRTELTSVSIPNSVIIIGANAFIRNSITAVALPDNVIRINSGAFAHNLLTMIAIPGNVFHIGERAFQNNQISDITIPGNVVQIGEGAFAHNPLTSITFEHNTGTIHQNMFTGSLGRVTQISIGANFNLHYDGDYPDVIWESFREAYAENGHRAGIYTLTDAGEWNWQPR